MVSVDQARQLLGMQVVDVAGDKVGTVKDVYLNDQTEQLSWMTVATGWFGFNESCTCAIFAAYTIVEVYDSVCGSATMTTPSEATNATTARPSTFGGVSMKHSWY